MLIVFLDVKISIRGSSCTTVPDCIPHVGMSDSLITIQAGWLLTWPILRGWTQQLGPDPRCSWPEGDS